MRTILILVTMLFSIPCFAETLYSIQINGISQHAEKYSYDGLEFNQINTGVGVQVTQSIEGHPNTLVHWSAGVLKNSRFESTIYLGGSLVRRWGGDIGFEAGLFAGILTYPSHPLGTLFAAAPMVSFGGHKIAVNIIAFPEAFQSPSFVFIQLRLGL